MRSFIHQLNSPACIITFGGQITDANTWFRKSIKAKTKAETLGINFIDLVADTEKLRMFIDYLLAGNVVQNEMLVFADPENGTKVQNVCASVLSFEKKQIFIQLFGTVLYQLPSISRAESLLSDITKLSPYLNNNGKQLLAQTVNTYENMLVSDEMAGKLAHIKDRLSQTWPVLSKSETDISALLALGFSVMEISIYGCYSASNVRSAVFRICKKLEVNSLEELLIVYRPVSSPGRYLPEASNLPR